MSHERGPGVTDGDRTPTTLEHRILRAVKRHLVEWPRRYVEMRVDAVGNKKN
ncbi:hypothetical protein [Halobellus ordinarius]|uniref:hypothetical protein n=1 Tax=Halobellus ordinarius TaxID=3075120 RepID=UPI0028801F00|nr:hypothetical protein [Halobellus sp. ZY16]